MRILALLPLFLSLTFSARATLVPGSEKPVTAPVRDVAPFDQAAGKLASDGNSFLAVWVDHTLFGQGDIHAARITPEGKRADDDPLIVAATGEEENRVDLAFGAGRHLVVWSTPAALRARFVDENASMSGVIEIASLTNFAQPRVAFNDDRFLVVWQSDAMFRGALIDTSGALVKTFDVGSSQQAGSDTALVAANGLFHFATSVVDFGGLPNGNGYPSNVGLQAIDEHGTVTPRLVIAPATTPVFDLRSVTNGDDFVVGWSTAIAISGGTVRTVKVAESGAVTAETIPAEDMWLHDVGVDASGFFAIYGARTTKFLRRLGASDAAVLATPDTETAVLDVARNGTRALALVRGDHRVGFQFGPAGGDLYVTRIDTGQIEPLVVAPRHQASPDIAAAGDLRLAAWCEYIGADRRLGIVASRVDASGNTIDVDGIDLHADVYHPAAPRVASNGTDWLVTWADGDGNLFGSRVRRDGTVLDATPFLIASNLYWEADIAVSWDGTQYVAVYFRGAMLRGLRTTVYATRVTAQGTIATPELTLSTQAANELPSIASGTDGSLVVWRHEAGLLGALVSRSGTVTNIALPGAVPYRLRPGVAWNGNTYLVASPFFGSFGQEIQWLRVTATGVVTTSLSTFIDSTFVSMVEIEAHGGGFLLYWDDAESMITRDASVFVARVSDQGVLAEGPRFVAPVHNDFMDRIGAAGNTVVYSRTIGHPTRELARVFSRTIHVVQGNPRRRAATH
ncbi:MAG TPA: hypothetical protein VEK79_00975 [Thermoanaerobaculia bacterium]|nr:hypothetical protein [Thermoanaerobaculia bacterium]